MKGRDGDYYSSWINSDAEKVEWISSGVGTEGRRRSDTRGVDCGAGGTEIGRVDYYHS